MNTRNWPVVLGSPMRFTVTRNPKAGPNAVRPWLVIDHLDVPGSPPERIASRELARDHAIDHAAYNMALQSEAYLEAKRRADETLAELKADYAQRLRQVTEPAPEGTI